MQLIVQLVLLIVKTAQSTSVEIPKQDQLKSEPEHEDKQAAQAIELLSVYVDVKKLDIGLNDKVLITPEILEALPDISLIKPMPKKHASRRAALFTIQPKIKGCKPTRRY